MRWFWITKMFSDLPTLHNDMDFWCHCVRFQGTNMTKDGWNHGLVSQVSNGRKNKCKMTKCIRGHLSLSGKPLQPLHWIEYMLTTTATTKQRQQTITKQTIFSRLDWTPWSSRVVLFRPTRRRTVGHRILTRNKIGQKPNRCWGGPCSSRRAAESGKASFSRHLFVFANEAWDFMVLHRVGYLRVFRSTRL